MGVGHPHLQRPRGERLRAVGRESALLAVTGVVTFATAGYGAVPWEPLVRRIGIGVAVPTVAGAAVLVVVARRRFPVSALLAAGALFGWYPSAAAALVMTSFAAGGLPFRRRRRAGAVAALLPIVIGLVGSDLQWKSTVLAFGPSVVICLVVPMMVRVLIDQRQRLYDAVREQARYLEENSGLAESTARLEERSRIAGEMHDLLGHRLSLISLYAGALELEATGRNRDLGDGARHVRTTVLTAMEELRGLLGLLPGNGVAGTGPGRENGVGTRADLTCLVAQSRAAGLPVDLVWTGEDLEGAALPVRHAVHRIVRECLTNVHRHASGAVTTAVVDRRPDGVLLVVRNGAAEPTVPGAGRPGSGRGLIGVRERVRLLSGTFRAGPLADGGFEVRAELPMAVPVPAALGEAALTAGAPVAPSGTRRARRTRARGRPRVRERLAGLGVGALAAIGLVSAVAVVSMDFTVVPFDYPAHPGPLGYFAAVPPGTPRSTVLQLFGPGDRAAALAARGSEPPRPPRADCTYWSFDPHQVNPGDRSPVQFERLCFRGDIVVDQTSFPARP